MVLTVVSRPGFIDSNPRCSTLERDVAEEWETKPLLDSGRADNNCYWVLVLSATGSRLYKGLRDTLTPILGTVFPIRWAGQRAAPITVGHADEQGTVVRNAVHIQLIQAVDHRVSE